MENAEDEELLKQYAIIKVRACFMHQFACCLSDTTCNRRSWMRLQT